MMNLIYALLVSIFSMLPVFAFAQEELPSDNHYVIKCNFPDAVTEPTLQSLVADPEWVQVVYLTRKGEVLPAQDVWLNVELKQSTPVAYIWNFATKSGQAHIKIQELITSPARFYILGRRPGTYECYKQFSERVTWYKRF